MTICVAVKVHDCLVFAADSATSLVGAAPNGESAILNVYAHGNKVFNLIRKHPIGAMTCGMGNIGRSFISSLTKVLRQRLEAGSLVALDSYSVEEVAVRAREFLFEETYADLADKPIGDHSLDFLRRRIFDDSTAREKSANRSADAAISFSKRWRTRPCIRWGEGGQLLSTAFSGVQSFRLKRKRCGPFMPQ